MESKKKKNLFQIEPMTDGKLLSAKGYNIALALFVLYGFIVNIIEFVFFKDFFLRINPIVFLIMYFVLAITGCIITNRSHGAIGAFIGYNMLVIPIGGLLSNLVVSYSSINPDIILYAFVGTAIVTGIMLIFSCVNPNLFLRIGSLLMTILIAVIVAELVLLLIAGHIPQIFSFIIVVIMSLLIGYDFAMANRVPRTLRNAIAYSVELYLDIVNIAIHLMDIFSDN